MLIFRPFFRVALGLILAHYAKREFETVLYVPSREAKWRREADQPADPTAVSCSVHRFSSATMPILNIFKKSVTLHLPRPRHLLMLTTDC